METTNSSLKKVLVTVAWAVTVSVEVDVSRIDNNDYLDEIKEKAANEAIDNLEPKCWYITDAKVEIDGDIEQMDEIID